MVRERCDDYEQVYLVTSSTKKQGIYAYEAWYLSLTAKAAALYHAAAAIAPGSGIVARISPETYVERPA